MLKIVNVPNPVLTTPTKKIEVFDASLKKLVKEMEKTLDAQVDPQGVGLAATQIGQGISLFIMKPTEDSPIEAIVNPEILKIEEGKISEAPKKKKSQLEGCLSIPRIWSTVHRPRRVFLAFQDLEGKKQQKWFTGFKAVIVQHEVDHLNGILFTQRAIEQQSQLYKEEKGELNPIEY
ncbi:peptide deformylase [Candidatus Roizmanbacteria bacterium]|nr:peptide deformylase [Candidatus Roizmanbacteria bacterium]